MTPREVLLAAADYLEANGWTAWEPGADIEGCKCVHCAMREATGGDHVSARMDALELFCERFGTKLRLWEAAPGRTRDEVVRALREAAR